MRMPKPSPRVLVVAGLTAMVLGALDPLEGSLLILPGTGLAALGALLSHSRFRRSLYWSFALVSIGVAALWGMSAMGGIGGPGQRSMWWALVLLPYPVGWVLGLVGVVRELREPPPSSPAT